MTWIQQFLLSFFCSLVWCPLLAYWLGKRHRRETEEIERTLGLSHTQTHKQLLELQQAIWSSKDIAQVRLYLQNKQEAFVRSLRTGPVKPLEHSSEKRT